MNQYKPIFIFHFNNFKLFLYPYETLISSKWCQGILSMRKIIGYVTSMHLLYEFSTWWITILILFVPFAFCILHLNTLRGSASGRPTYVCLNIECNFLTKHIFQNHFFPPSCISVFHMMPLGLRDKSLRIITICCCFISLPEQSSSIYFQGKFFTAQKYIPCVPSRWNEAIFLSKITQNEKHDLNL